MPSKDRQVEGGGGRGGYLLFSNPSNSIEQGMKGHVPERCQIQPCPEIGILEGLSIHIMNIM